MRMVKPALWLLALSLFGCASVVPPADDFAANRCQTVIEDGIEGLPTFEIGAILEVNHLDGKADFDASYDIQAMRLAIQELNSRDVAGHRFRMRICDTHADWSTGGGQVTRDLATWLIDHEHVQAIVADASADTQAMSAVTVKKGVVVIAISSTSEDLTYLPDNGLVWRVAPSDIYQGVVLAHMVTSSAIAADAKVSLLAVKTPYGDGLRDALSRQLPDRLQVHTFDADGKGLDVALQAAAADTPGALIVVANSPLVARIANARIGIPALAKVDIYLADGACDNDLVKQDFAANASLAGARCTRPGQPPNSVYKQFQEHYKGAFGNDPAQSSYTQHSYDVVYCLALAHAWALGSKGAGNVTGPALAEGLRHLSSGDAYAFQSGDVQKMFGALIKGQDINVEGASGPLDFNPETGEAPSGYESFNLGAHGVLTHDKFYSVEDQGKGKYVVLPVDVTAP